MTMWRAKPGNNAGNESPLLKNGLARDRESSYSLLLHHALHVAHDELLHVAVLLVVGREFEQRGIGFSPVDVPEGRGGRLATIRDLIVNGEILQVSRLPNERL